MTHRTPIRRAFAWVVAWCSAWGWDGVPPARAALTSSEQAQITSYVAEGRVATAARVRALIARPDLTIDESAAALGAALTPVVFHEPRAAYLHEMLYGSASLPSRGVLAVAVTRALAARADAVLSRRESDLDQDEAARAELARIFAFLDADVANAGQPHGAGHDPNAGLGADAYDEAARALATVIEHHPRWLKGDAAIPAAAEPVRAQLQLTILDMTNDTTTRRFDAADRLWLTGSRRTPLTEAGILVLDDGHTDPARIDATRVVLARTPGVRDAVEAVALLELTPAPRARNEVLVIQADARRPAPFGDDVTPSPADPDLTALTRALSGVVVRRALEMRPALRAQAEHDAAAAAGDPARSLGTPAGASAVAALGTAVQLLLLDAPRAVDSAIVRAVAGHSEAAAVLSDALGALASLAVPAAESTTLTLGRAQADGSVVPVNVTDLRLAPAGFATRFTLGGHVWSFTRDDAGRVAPARDGQAPTLAFLEHARAPVADGTLFSGGGIVFARMAGAPRAGVSAGGRVRVTGEGAVGTAAPGDDVAVDATVDVEGRAAIAVRAIATPAGFKGVGLEIDGSTTPPKASLRIWDGSGKGTELASAMDLPTSRRAPVRVVVKGQALEARVGAVVLRAAVPAGFAHGDVAIAVRGGASLEATGWSVKRP